MNTTNINPNELTTTHRIALAENPATSREELAWLSFSDEHSVAYALIDNPSTSYSTLRAFALKVQHADTLFDGYNYEGVADAAAEVIAERFPEADLDDEYYEG